MKTALIATLYNEAGNVSRWWERLQRQTVQLDEIVVVDGGSTDGTWEKLQELARQSKVPVRLKQQRCNIAEGRNLAIQMTDAEIIASTDAGSYPEVNWLVEITRPLLNDPTLDVVGGRSLKLVENDFQQLVVDTFKEPPEPSDPETFDPSSRNVAFRRKAWAGVGGYPEWLTLTAEDALYNFNLHQAGFRFHYNRDAVVAWPIRENARAYFNMIYHYGYGAAEARLYVRNFLFSIVMCLCPFALLLSRHRTKALWFRYRFYVFGLSGWIRGSLFGRRAPAGWQRIEGILLSPEALASRARHQKNQAGK